MPLSSSQSKFFDLIQGQSKNSSNLRIRMAQEFIKESDIDDSRIIINIANEFGISVTSREAEEMTKGIEQTSLVNIRFKGKSIWLNLIQRYINNDVLQFQQRLRDNLLSCVPFVKSRTNDDANLEIFRCACEEGYKFKLYELEEFVEVRLKPTVISKFGRNHGIMSYANIWEGYLLHFRTARELNKHM